MIDTLIETVNNSAYLSIITPLMGRIKFVIHRHPFTIMEDYGQRNSAAIAVGKTL